jgi:UDP-N-acetylglucosamine transferase subunit ALG13
MNVLGWEIVIACDDRQKKILSEAVPQAQFIHLKGYGISYGNSGIYTILKIILQIPRIIYAMRSENTRLKEIISLEKPDLILSDNRYGFFNRQIKSILIIHQLTIKTGMGKLVDRQVNHIHQRLLQRFSACWIPDVTGEDSLAGALSKPLNGNSLQPLYYLGGLSRFKIRQAHAIENELILILLSGPEPQRSILERMVTRQLPFGNYRFIILRGGVTVPMPISDNERIQFYNHLPSDKLQELLTSAAYVISRSGYSSIMDHLKLGCRSILIATPGQEEQVYLADHVKEKKWAYAIEQKNLSLQSAIHEADHFPFVKIPPRVFGMMEDSILQCLKDMGYIPKP